MNPEQCRNACEVLFCTPDDSGVLKCSGGVLLHRLETFLRALCQNPAPAGNADVADLLNALSKSVGEKSFASCWAGELFDALAGFNIFPDDLKNASGGSDEEFLLEKAWTISGFLRNFDIDQTGNDSGKLLPRCREIFKSLPQSEEELIELLKNSDPFSSGQVFCYRNNRFVPVVPVSVRKVDTFFGYPGVRSSFQDHFHKSLCLFL